MSLFNTISQMASDVAGKAVDGSAIIAAAASSGRITAKDVLLLIRLGFDVAEIVSLTGIAENVIDALIAQSEAEGRA